jgi:hypothetical protein
MPINYIEKDSLPLLELLAKTTYLTQITHPSDAKCDNPVGYGCGFLVEYKKIVFFVTADHVVHLDDYETKNRTGNDYTVAIFNNVSPESNFLTTVITPLGGFYYMEKFNLEKPDDISELMDVSLCIMKEKHFEYPFLTDEVKFVDLTINAGEKKLIIPNELLAEPESEKPYFIYGVIKTKIKGIRLERQPTLKSDLKYIGRFGDYVLLNSPNTIDDYADWEGLSGSPVISETGECIGILCSVTKDTKSIWVMPIRFIKMLMDIAINEEGL